MSQRAEIAYRQWHLLWQIAVLKITPIDMWKADSTDAKAIHAWITKRKHEFLHFRCSCSDIRVVQHQSYSDKHQLTQPAECSLRSCNWKVSIHQVRQTNKWKSFHLRLLCRFTWREDWKVDVHVKNKTEITFVVLFRVTAGYVEMPEGKFVWCQRYFLQ